MLNENLQKLREKVVSLDIETTGTGASDRIWSAGISGLNNGVGWEEFSDPRAANATESVEEMVLRRSGRFGQEQIDRGSLAGLNFAISNNRTINQKNLAEEVFKNTQNKAILIQNTNFENEHLARALGDEDAGLSDKFRYNLLGQKNPNRKLFVPPKITNLRKEAEALHKTGDIKGSSEKYTSILEEYMREVNVDDGKSVVFELRDFSKAALSKAASLGFIDPKTFDSNTKVDFMAPTFLGADNIEMHTALSDSKQQERLMYRMIEIHDELSSGQISTETEAAFRRHREGIKEAAKENFKKELESLHNDITEKGYTALIGETIPTGAYNLDVEGPDGITQITNNRYEKAPKTSDINVAIEHLATSRYEGRVGREDAKEIIQSFSSEKGFDTSERLNSKIDQMPRRESIGRIKESNKIDNIVDALKRTTPIERGIVAGVVGLVAFASMFGESDAEKREKERIQDPKIKNGKTVFNMYDPNVVFKDNDELNRHYLM